MACVLELQGCGPAEPWVKSMLADLVNSPQRRENSANDVLRLWNRVTNVRFILCPPLPPCGTGSVSELSVVAKEHMLVLPVRQDHGTDAFTLHIIRPSLQSVQGDWVDDAWVSLPLSHDRLLRVSPLRLPGVLPRNCIYAGEELQYIVPIPCVFGSAAFHSATTKPGLRGHTILHFDSTGQCYFGNRAVNKNVPPRRISAWIFVSCLRGTNSSERFYCDE